MAVSANLYVTILDMLVNAGYHLGLFTTLPTNAENSNGTEVTGGSYARLASDAGFPTASDNTTITGRGFTQLANNGALNFPTASANWGTVVGWGLFSALTGGTCAMAFPFTDTPVDAIYSQTGTTVTVTSNAHGLTTSDSVYVRFFNTGNADKTYAVASVTTNTFTFTVAGSATITNADIRYGKTKSYTVDANSGLSFPVSALTFGVKG
jgi:hypothetical protein